MKTLVEAADHHSLGAMKALAAANALFLLTFFIVLMMAADRLNTGF